MASKVARTLLRLLFDRRGAAAVEFGLVMPMLVVLLFGTVDVGAMTYESMQVSVAAHAGADYAMHSGWNSTAIQTAVTSAVPITVTANPAPTLTQACVVSGALVTTANSTCASGLAPGSYVTVSARATYTPIIAWSAFNLPSTLSAQATVRIS